MADYAPRNCEPLVLSMTMYDRMRIQMLRISSAQSLACVTQLADAGNSQLSWRSDASDAGPYLLKSAWLRNYGRLETCVMWSRAAEAFARHDCLLSVESASHRVVDWHWRQAVSLLSKHLLRCAVLLHCPSESPAMIC